MRNIEGKVVVITGASSGMGMVTAEKLASLGAKVVLAARREDRLRELTSRLGQAAVYQVTDVTRREDLDTLVKTAIGRFGKVDVFWNNAGVMPLSFLDEGKVDEWDRMVDVNLKGVLYGINAVLPHMLERGSGHMLFTSSVGGLKTFPGASVYCGTKFAVKAIADSLRQETSGKVRVTTIYPGAFATELGHDITSERAGEFMRQNFDLEFLDPIGIADAVVYAISQPEKTAVNEITIRPLSQIP